MVAITQATLRVCATGITDAFDKTVNLVALFVPIHAARSVATHGGLFIDG